VYCVRYYTISGVVYKAAMAMMVVVVMMMIMIA
jgi:hypothetical protein